MAQYKRPARKAGRHIGIIRSAKGPVFGKLASRGKKTGRRSRRGTRR